MRHRGLLVVASNVPQTGATLHVQLENGLVLYCDPDDSARCVIAILPPLRDGPSCACRMSSDKQTILVWRRSLLG